MSKSVWLFMCCVISNKIITAAPSALPQLPVLSEGITDSTLCSPGSNCQESEPILQDVLESTQAETTSEYATPSIIKESIEEPIENPILDVVSEAQKGCKFELEATEFTVTDLNATNDEELLKSTKVAEENEDVEEKPNPKNKTELSYHQSSKNDEILSKIETAISKSKENRNQKTIKAAPNMVPIFKPKCNSVQTNNNQNTINTVKKCTSESNRTPQNSRICTICRETSKEATSNFSITGLYLKPLTGNDVNFITSEKFANIKSANIAPSTRTTDSDVKLMPNIISSLAQRNQNIQFNSVPSAISKSNNAVMVLYKPETISLEQVYGEFMKKLTLTVLVPYYVSKLTSIPNSR